MTMFLSSYVNGMDKKGRVSVPASFRSELVSQTRKSVVVYAAPNENFYTLGLMMIFIAFAAKINKLPPMSKERQRLSRTILSAAKSLSFDSDGRVVLPETMKAHIGADDKVLFAGQGEYFTIWKPENFELAADTDSGFYDTDIETFSAEWSE